MLEASHDRGHEAGRRRDFHDHHPIGWTVDVCPALRRLHNALVQNQTTSDSLRLLLEMPRKSWWARLPFGVRMAAGTVALLAVIGGGGPGAAALPRHDPKPRIVTAVGDAAATGSAPQEPAGAPQEPAGAPQEPA